MTDESRTLMIKMGKRGGSSHLTASSSIIAKVLLCCPKECPCMEKASAFVAVVRLFSFWPVDGNFRGPNQAL